MIIDELFLDELQIKAKENDRLRIHFDLRNNKDELSQRMLNVMEQGTNIPIHRHTNTSETVIIIRGKMDEIFYNDKGEEIKRFHLDPDNGNYGLQIPANTWHSVDAKTQCTIIEIKAWKYDAELTEEYLITQK